MAIQKMKERCIDCDGKGKTKCPICEDGFVIVPMLEEKQPCQQPGCENGFISCKKCSGTGTIIKEIEVADPKPEPTPQPKPQPTPQPQPKPQPASQPKSQPQPQQDPLDYTPPEKKPEVLSEKAMGILGIVCAIVGLFLFKSFIGIIVGFFVAVIIVTVIGNKKK